MNTPKEDFDAITEVIGWIVAVLAFLIEITFIVIGEIVSFLVFLLEAIFSDD